MSHRDKKLIEQVQKKAWQNRNGVIVPRVTGDVGNPAAWPVCGTCHREVEAVELKNQNGGSVEVWARCHGKEDWQTIRFPYRIHGNDEAVNDHIRMAMRAFTPFETSITL